VALDDDVGRQPNIDAEHNGEAHVLDRGDQPHRSQAQQLARLLQRDAQLRERLIARRLAAADEHRERNQAEPRKQGEVAAPAERPDEDRPEQVEKHAR
jgi:hypothetical protein